MQITEFITKGLMIGFAMAAIVGPITIMCIQRTISVGFRIGFLTGMGSSVANFIYCIIVVVCLVDVSEFMLAYEGLAAGIGGLVLAYLALITFKSNSLVSIKTNTNDVSSFNSFITGFFISVASPLTIFIFLSLYTSMELEFIPSYEYQCALFMASGVLLGSIVWWLVLAGVVEKMRNYFSENMLKNINFISIGMLLILSFCAFIKLYNCGLPTYM